MRLRMMFFFDLQIIVNRMLNILGETPVITQLFLAVFLGALIGLEREYKRRGAGLQTYSLVSLAACVFTILGLDFLNRFGNFLGASLDPLRIIQAVAVGIGFIGAGAVLRREFFVEGLTTAAGLWLVSAIGVAIGAGLTFLAIAATFSALTILVGFGFLEAKFFPASNEKRQTTKVAR